MSSSFFCSSSAGTGGGAAGGGGTAATSLGGGSSFLGSSWGGGGGGAAATGAGLGASFLAGSDLVSLGCCASSCLALRAPWRSLVWSLALTRSTAIGSGSATRSSRCAWMVKSAHPRIAACSKTEVTNPPRTSPPSLRPFRFGDQRNLGEPGRFDAAHHPHHRAVVDSLVAANEDLLVVAAFGDGPELGRDLVELDLGLLDEDFAGLVDADGDGVLVGLQLLALGLRQLDRHAHGQERCRH